MNWTDFLTKILPTIISVALSFVVGRLNASINRQAEAAEKKRKDDEQYRHKREEKEKNDQSVLQAGIGGLLEAQMLYIWDSVKKTSEDDSERVFTLEQRDGYASMFMLYKKLGMDGKMNAITMNLFNCKDEYGQIHDLKEYQLDDYIYDRPSVIHKIN